MSKAETDPIDFLNSMRQRTAQLLGQLDTDHNVDVTDIGRAVPKTSCEAACDGGKAVSDAAPGPPENLSPDQEVEWWKRRIADLSGPCTSVEGSKSGLEAEAKQESKGQGTGFKATSKGAK
jgi:hypothetical protein